MQRTKLSYDDPAFAFAVAKALGFAESGRGLAFTTKPTPGAAAPTWTPSLADP